MVLLIRVSLIRAKILGAKYYKATDSVVSGF
jgi:hypothetical protein